MYVTRLAIRRIRSIKELDIELPPDRLAGWHVLLGDNGAGKSTVVRSLALGLVGPEEAPALRQPWSDWLRHGAQEGSIEVDVRRHVDLDSLSGPGTKPKQATIGGKLLLKRFPAEVRGPDVELSAGLGNGELRIAQRTLWGKGAGWFSASFGPFRRFSGGNPEWNRVFSSYPKLAPHLSAFGEDVALAEALEWLKARHNRERDYADEPTILPVLKRFINEGELLPHGARLERVTSDAVVFIDGDGCETAVDQMSDGYRSILSLTFELIRQMVLSYGPDLVFRAIREERMEIDLPGVVAIDEVDAHLHPAWQKRIGPWFLKYFPKLQFFVTTHSPIICQAAGKGTVWRLPTPGSGETACRIEGDWWVNRTPGKFSQRQNDTIETAASLAVSEHHAFAQDFAVEG